MYLCVFIQAQVCTYLRMYVSYAHTDNTSTWQVKVLHVNNIKLKTKLNIYKKKIQLHLLLHMCV